MTNATDSLFSLREIASVIGSAWLDAEGVLLARDLPPLFSARLLRQVSSRLKKLDDLLGGGPDQPNATVITYDAHRLCVRKLQRAGWLLVLCGYRVDVETLQGAMAVVAPQLERQAFMLPARGEAEQQAHPSQVLSLNDATGDMQTGLRTEPTGIKSALGRRRVS